MENQPNRNAGPSSIGLANKPALQSKPFTKGKNSRHAKRSPNHSTAPSQAGEGSVSGANEQASNAAISVISALQEFVQDSKEYRMPSQHSILQWTFEETTVNSYNVQYLATVRFVLDGVPHHTQGDWQSSKAEAKRDAAGRALVLFVSRWGQHWQEQMCQPDTENFPQNGQNSREAQVYEKVPTAVGGEQLDRDSYLNAVDILKNFCRNYAPCEQTVPQLTVSWDGNYCQGFAEVILFGVPHMFGGATGKWTNEDMALADVARRVLWYFQCPGFDDGFAVDLDALVSHVKANAAPPSCWTGLASQS